MVATLDIKREKLHPVHSVVGISGLGLRHVHLYPRKQQGYSLLYGRGNPEGSGVPGDCAQFRCWGCSCFLSFGRLLKMGGLFGTLAYRGTIRGLWSSALWLLRIDPRNTQRSLKKNGSVICTVIAM